MNHCELTSRIVQAAGGVQLYMQRALLGLENFRPDAEAADAWKWMSTYRVWEANRKVFLYAEDYIEPDLRDDKTPLFLKVEHDLQQSDVTTNAVEAAYRTYLESLDDLSQTEIVAMWDEQTVSAFGPLFQPLFNTSHKLHVFGRTKTPHRYMYRKYDAGAWTPWEDVELDIEGDNLMPFVMNGILYLAWAVMTEVARDDNKNKTTPGQGSENELRIRIAYSARRAGAWGPKRIADDKYAVKLGASPKTQWVTFTTTVGSAGAQIQCLVTNPDKHPHQSMLAATFVLNPCTSVAAGLPQAVFAVDTSSHVDPIFDAINAQNKQFGVPALPDPTVVITNPGYVDFDPSVGQGTLVAVGPPLPATVQDQRFSTPAGQSLSLLFPTDFASTFLLYGKVLGQIPGTQLTTTWSRDTEPSGVRPYLVVQDDRRTLFLKLISVPYVVFGPPVSLPLSPHGAPALTYSIETSQVYRVESLIHPFVCSFRSALETGGFDGLFRWSGVPTPTTLQFQKRDVTADYAPLAFVELPPPTPPNQPVIGEIVDFRLGSAVGIYNWELFFHAPFLIATKLMNAQRFEDARRWLHYIFDPTDGSTAPAPQRYWKFRPFYENQDLATIQAGLDTLADNAYVQQMNGWANGTVSAALDDIMAEIQVWRADPFNPHALARIRPLIYQKAVVIRYIENLLAWGDQLFTEDTLESINEATQLYIMAQNLLGTKPTIIPKAAPTPQTYSQLQGVLDAFSNAAIETETISPFFAFPSATCSSFVPPAHSVFQGLYFCIPENPTLLALFDTVADRLFKIRHCMNIAGVVRQLPLFAPEIDPALLVRAKAAGVDIGSLLGDLTASIPNYRYAVLSAKAEAFAASVQALGNGLLSALEKRDGEALALLRAGQEIEIQTLILASKQTAVREAQSNIDALQAARNAINERFTFYSNVPLVTPAEVESLALGAVAQTLSLVGQSGHAGGAAAYAIPQFAGGGAGIASPVVIVLDGGQNAGAAADAGASAVQAAASAISYQAQTIATLASYQRRFDEWQLQARIAKDELDQTDKQIQSAEFRLEIAQDDLATTQRQLQHANDIQSFYESKFTSQDLYDWLVSETSATYFQGYKLAFEMARRAERAWQYELADDTQSFVSFGYWDSLKMGLLAGERLILDLRRMDAAYTAQNRRELELVKTVSLSKLDPFAFLKLQQTGKTTFSMPEKEYDRDHPDHFLRRLKNVAATLECTTGPYEGAHGTLSLTPALTQTRTSPTVGTGQPVTWPQIGPTLVPSTMATSVSLRDAGLFETNLRDDRYLPFEGFGAHFDGTGSQWSFQLSGGNELPYSSISDLVLDVRYTARPGRAPAAFTLSRTYFVRIRTDFVDAWQAFMSGAATSLAAPVLTTAVAKGFSDTLNSITRIRVYGLWNGGAGHTLMYATPGATPTDITASATQPFAPPSSLTQFMATPTWSFNDANAVWQFTPGDKADLADVWIIFDYSTAFTP